MTVLNDDSIILASDPRIVFQGNTAKWIPAGADSIIARIYAVDAFNPEFRDSTNVFAWRAKEVETGFTLRGRVIECNISSDTTDIPLEYVIVRAEGADTLQTLTDNSGNYILENLSGGSYKIIFNKNSDYTRIIHPDFIVSKDTIFNAALIPKTQVTPKGDFVNFVVSEFSETYAISSYKMNPIIWHPNDKVKKVVLDGWATYQDSINIINSYGSLTDTTIIPNSWEDLHQKKYFTGADSLAPGEHGILVRKDADSFWTNCFTENGFIKLAIIYIPVTDMTWWNWHEMGRAFGKSSVNSYESNMHPNVWYTVTPKDVLYTLIAGKWISLRVEKKNNTNAIDLTE